MPNIVNYQFRVMIMTPEGIFPAHSVKATIDWGDERETNEDGYVHFLLDLDAPGEPTIRIDPREWYPYEPMVAIKARMRDNGNLQEWAGVVLRAGMSNFADDETPFAVVDQDGLPVNGMVSDCTFSGIPLTGPKLADNVPGYNGHNPPPGSNLLQFSEVEDISATHVARAHGVPRREQFWLCRVDDENNAGPRFGLMYKPGVMTFCRDKYGLASYQVEVTMPDPAAPPDPAPPPEDPPEPA